ncbi:28S ribosomal protein S35, mitochondrial isoform X2 [Pipistrellus kuhlii]|uniref:28S ribosomal protein S35, mitochondrial isoform X2 n=1 Tax=Pipistrellus kuhlii TaxID=59472 RepID=UPI00174EE766|nr:28S ribosomal protein S35, mitochondrial isoform X2 [Pipistrellus kuhlii]
MRSSGFRPATGSGVTLVLPALRSSQSWRPRRSPRGCVCSRGPGPCVPSPPQCLRPLSPGRQARNIFSHLPVPRAASCSSLTFSLKSTSSGNFFPNYLVPCCTTERTSRLERPSRRKALPPRTEKMAVDQDWPSVYPVAAPFKPSAVPLPVRMGYPVKMGVPMAKEGNLELLKIPNFLHLTPVAIKKHCEALKDFCTEWPAALDSDEKCEKHFPIEIDTADYVSAGPSIRNPKARVVTLRKTEDWEKNITEADMQEYIWTNSSSEKNILETLLQIKAAEKNLEVTKEELLGTKEIEDYKKCVVSLKNEGDSEYTLSQYKESVKRLLNLT